MITAEPKGKTVRKKSNLYIIQKHAASHLHYDFRLELKGVLLSWAIPKGPCLDPTVKRLAVHVEDHPLEYGSFEGIIPKGQYGGGTVMLWDRGTWECTDANPHAAYHGGHINFILYGKKLQGEWTLIRIKHDDKTWLLMKSNDNYARSLKEYDVLAEEPNSVLHDQSIDDIADHSTKTWNSKRGKMAHRHLKISALQTLKKTAIPTTIKPELCTLVDEPPTGNEWLHEIKLDGYRFIGYKYPSGVRLMSRNNKDWTDKFPSIAAAISRLATDHVIVDGEIVVLDKKQHSNFQLLQNALSENEQVPFYYYIFDILYYDHYNLTSLTLLKRKDILKQLLDASDSDILRFSDHIIGSGDKLVNKACELGLEGIVSKRIDSPYTQKRTHDWLKIKCIQRQEFIIGGFTPPKGNRDLFGALLLGTYDEDQQLIFNGHVGTGFNESSLHDIHQLMLKHKIKTCPFATTPPQSKNAVWVKPILIAEIEYTEKTNEGMLRHPSFKGLRQDKSAKGVTIEMAEPITHILPNKKPLYNLTHPDKILYPEDKFTKQDIADYYQGVQPWILPYIKNRPIAIVRCPDNYKVCFFQKNKNKSIPNAVHSISIKKKTTTENAIYVDDYAGLMTLPQLGVLEIHPWGCTIDNVNHPDMIIFDLDPDPEIKWKKVVEAALDIRQHLADLKLNAFIKTTGGKGLHIVIPIRPHYTWDEIQTFSHTFVNYLTLERPDKYTNTITKSKRVGKIFIDYLRNQKGATAIAPYSTRARIHAPVSVPISWDELATNKNGFNFTIKNVIKRLEKIKDPWKDFFKKPQSLDLNV